ncbi:MULTISPECIES: class I SAM-dependent methyltransferase [unclassified Bacillus (in: firmicutes)]|uniref:class I SAM-dependent methyltransferase n=1 Tax=unclassified Bacillus (in: firmicutes) TaxID=185979 RepID=UPI000E3CF172|nr:MULTISPECIES: class I SAM-dependent methyltransferase [unclassified Bacillus (in: firmicutes)]RFU68276.1 class I SAM-dependent methyltransferase [Bacillus sp. V59.32b]CAH0347292.1 2-methoxy-6-polyprenyl-1,4-benzoquinol methylase, mitochondrial [Bacillus sp. CECT 9360]
MLETIAKQFRKPVGILGRLAGMIMAFENRKINRWTIDRLKVKPGDHILEVGFGPGYAIEEMLQKYDNLKIDGVDVSKTMLETAHIRNEKAIDKGRLNLYQKDVMDYNQREYQYDKVISVNNYPLWKNKRKSLMRIHQLLKDGGRIAITVQPREDDASREKTFSHAFQIEQDLVYAGFRDISVKFKKVKPELTVCVTGVCKKKHI